MLLTKFVGKPYAGKLHVRFDEGVGEGVQPSSPYSTASFVFFVVKKLTRFLSSLTHTKHIIA
jgi:hypothetical protein